MNRNTHKQFNNNTDLIAEDEIDLPRQIILHKKNVITNKNNMNVNPSVNISMIENNIHTFHEKNNCNNNGGHINKR